MATRVFEKPVSRDMLDLQRSIAITASGNTHAAISTGQFVYVKSHSTLTDGLYVATDDIVEDGTLSSSNLTADTSGGLNALQAQIDDITGDIGTVPSGKTLQGQINVNSAHIDNLQDGLAIVSDNNTHAAIASGQFVYVKNHGTLDEGMYKATAAIAQNETLSSSNLTAVTDGGLNGLAGNISTLNSKMTNIDPDGVTNVYTGDLNNLISTGNWLSTDGTNRPIVSGWLVVSVDRAYKDSNASVVKQIATATATGTVYSRVFNGTSWAAWQELAPKSYVSYFINGTVKINGTANRRYLYINYSSISNLWGGIVFMVGTSMWHLRLIASDTAQANLTKIFGANDVTVPTITKDTTNSRIVIDMSSPYTHWGVMMYGQSVNDAYLSWA